MSSSELETIDTLVAQAEALLRRGVSRGEVAAVLERILTLAPDGSDARRFAHRHLAELRIEEAPWAAALHLRKALAVDRDDDVAHALMGLCQALLGNFRAAVSAYRRALTISPRNPWYHHNLGHLLDVALTEPRTAMPHLRSAHRLEPLEDEITASLAHCLAAAGELEEAKALADEAVRGAPRNKDHRALLGWIERGAPKGAGPHAALSGRRGGATTSGGAQSPGTPAAPRQKPPKAGRTDDAPKASRANDGRVVRADDGRVVRANDGRVVRANDGRVVRADDGRVVRADDGAVIKLLERHMREAGFSARQLEVARTLFRDYLGKDGVRVTKPEVFAAAAEYAMTRVVGMHGVTQRQIAKRYGCAPTSVGARFDRMKEALALIDRDPRYEH